MMPDEVELPLEDGAVDLHAFHPRDLRTLVPDVIGACLEKGINPVRFIHGKGTGAVRESVRALLSRDPRVVRVEQAPPHLGGWGATVAWLKTDVR